MILLARKPRQPRRWSGLYFVSYLMLLCIILWKIINISNDDHIAQNYLLPGSLCILILVQLLIVNLESIRDLTPSAVFYLGCLMIFVVSLISTWNTVSYMLRPPNPGQPGFANSRASDGWALSITPYELSEYLFCACAFFNYLLAFFSDRLIPKPPQPIPMRLIRPEELPADFDVVASDEKRPKTILKLEEGKSNEISKEPESSLCPEKYVSFPSRVTFFWVTKLIITGYRNTLQSGHLWVVDSKNLAAHVVPAFLRNICKYLHVDISGELDGPHTANSQFSANWVAQDTPSSTSDDQKSGIADANLKTGNNTIADETSARRSTFGDFSAYVEGVGGGKGKVEKRSRTMSGVADIGKKSSPSVSTNLLPNIQLRNSARSSESKPPSSSRKGSSVGDVEAGLLSSDSFKQGKLDGTGSGKTVGDKRRPQKSSCGLIKALACTYGFRIFIGGVFKIGHDVCLLSGPVFFKYLLQSMKPDSKEPAWHGYCYAILMFIIAFVQSIMLHQYFRAQNIVGMDMRTAIISAVYRKSLRLSAASRGESTTGEITNLMSIDAGRFHMLMFNIHVLWSAPFQVSLAIYLLWQQIGYSVFPGVLILLIMIPINTLVAKKSKSLQEKQLKTTDRRIKLISEILNGIRVLKLYAWEPSFIKEVGNIRRRELHYLRKFLFLDCGTTFVFSCAPTLFALAAFATFVLSSPDNHLTAEKIFVSLALLNIMRFPLFMFPTLLSNLVQELYLEKVVLFSLFSCLALAVGSVRAAKRLHQNLLSRILHVPTGFFDLIPHGRIMNRFSNDVSITDHHLMISFRSMTNTLFGCLVTFALTVIPSAYILIFLAILIAFYGFMQVIFVATRRQLQRLDSVSKSPIFSHFAETLLGTETIRAYGMCDLFVSTNDARVDTNNRALFSVIVSNRWLSMMLETVGNLLTLATSVAFVVATREGSLNPGLAGLVISYTLNVTQGLSWFVRMATELETNVVSVERIHEYSELAIEAPWNVPDKQPPPQWPEGGIEFINYSTRYREDLDLVLKSISVSINPSEKIGIVGRTGSGKSSLVLALFRIIEPTEGEIRLDGINISEIGLHDIRGRITLIPQDPVLFSGTLRFNLDPFNDYTDEAVWEALSTANLRCFVEETSTEGLNMPISEGGGNLSQGQRQLICLARALLRRSKILVLDEATAAVDPHTDRLIQQAVRTEFADSTVLTIAHRLNTILDYDRIMVLDAGRLVEIGSPSELASRPDSIFHGMLKESNLLKTVIRSKAKFWLLTRRADAYRDNAIEQHGFGVRNLTSSGKSLNHDKFLSINKRPLISILFRDFTRSSLIYQKKEDEMSTGLFDRQTSKPQARPLLQFKAGKMTMNADNQVQADARRGYAYLYQATGDYSVHFCWFDRRTGLIEDNFVLVPREAEFKPVPQCKTGRVYVLKLSAPHRRFFLWMQEPNASNDAQICETVNKYINAPPAPLIGTGNTSGLTPGGLLASARSGRGISDLFTGMRGLSGMNQNDLFTLFSMGMGLGLSPEREGPALAFFDESIEALQEEESSSAQPLPVPTSRVQMSSRVEAPAGHTASSTSVPTSIANASSAPSDKRPKLCLQDLHSILSNIRPPDQTSKNVDLTLGVDVKTLSGIMEKKPEVAERLAAHLPQVDPEDQQLTPTQAVVTNLHAPQFQSALKTFSEAFESGQLGPALSQFGLDEEVVKSSSTGDLEAFAAAMEKSFGEKKSTAGSSSCQKEDDTGSADDSKKKDDGSEKMDTS
nr:canalicular multispecific organic anion [Hymenolepis microstoma]